jgi:hypothetical protein
MRVGKTTRLVANGRVTAAKRKGHAHEYLNCQL